MLKLFFIKDNKIYTPKDELPILNGIMKKRIEDICIELNIEVVKKEIYIDEINDFEFSFVTNSLMGAMKVKLIENTKYNNDNILLGNSNIMTINDYVKMMVLSYQNKYPDTELSKKLGISRKSLWEKRKKLDIEKKK